MIKIRLLLVEENRILRDGLIAMLKRATETGFSDMEWVSRDTDLACLHGEPEFERLIGKSESTN